ncbi:glycerophosphodiester phosphodiesterase [Desulfolutivibrio sulfoxidireducens]|uniref:glycerophosphodiester phosphodiesterase n=1 Tax=Desulfolutivibrio sulfoxidireducens TaxID=2773299 RepID=UPI00159DF7E4|nr:glycerophosphodiester phosphodiesterase family protein [Desulfolutivibrio sulfoxidireducens]QLA15446.1 glycerophosphodiester phosphodiesterase [Desulfolutivibrio sulfoxidireducens]
MFFDHIPASRPIGAHRGARSLAPENTLPAIEKAHALGAHFVEIDVRLTADGHLVVFHDDTPRRTTSVAASPLAARAAHHVDTFTLAELRSLDAGSWFAATDPFKTIADGKVPQTDLSGFPGTPIPTLAEVLAFCRGHDFPVNVEIKDHAGRPGHEAITPEVLALVRRTQTRDLVLVSSFNHHYLTQAAALDPDIPRAALFEHRLPRDIRNHLRSLEAAACHPDHAIAPPAVVQSLLEAGLRVTLWTVNDPARARTYPPAAGVITDVPQRFVR